MRFFLAALFAAGLFSGSASAQDKPLFAPAPAWVKPVDLPADTAKTGDTAPVRILVSDQQVALEPGRQTVYSEAAVKILTPQGLEAGNLSFPWRPDSGTLSVHKLLIRRGDAVIDVLASGQTFTIVRREANLESAMLDGILTANIQPEGLQVGDIVHFAISLSVSDPTLAGHVEHLAAPFEGLGMDRARLRMQWPSSLPIRVRQGERLPALKPVRKGGITEVELSLDNVEPLVPPKGAPARYAMRRMIEATDFASWAELGALMAPLYEKSAKIAPGSPLHTEVERIRALSPDTERRAEAALALVQDRVRYVLLAMGTGNLVPADAATTWERRYGDCKAKTALLLALLDALGIDAHPVAVSSVLGDGLDQRLPMIGLFDHVLVRATIAGKDYWLDGTRTGDTSLARIAVPAFGWGLPLIPQGAALVRMLPTPLDLPGQSDTIRIDATAGLSVPAPTRIETILRGDDAINTNRALANLMGAARDRALRDYWRNRYDFIEVKSASATFDAASGELRLVLDGAAQMDWEDGWYETDGTDVGYEADFSRDPGPGSDAPFAVPYPYFSKTVETILLPPGFSDLKDGAGADVNRTVAGIEYRRTSRFADNIFTIEKTERSIAPEFPASEAPAAQAALRELADQTVYLRQPRGYRLTDAEVAALLASTPATADAFVERGNMLLDMGRYGEAVRDFDRALALDPDNARALASRGLSRVWMRDFENAVVDLDAAHTANPRNIFVFRGRGIMAEQKGAYREAIAAYTAALDISPNDSFSLVRRAHAYFAERDSDAALRDAAAGLKQDPRAFELHLLRANVFRKQGKNDEALAEAEAITAANPADAYAHVVAASIYGTFDRDADAMRAFDRAIAIDPEPYIYLNRSLRRPKTDIAGRRADIEEALKLDPKFSDAIDAKAGLQAESGDIAGAIATYGMALAASPDHPALLLGRGIAHARAGDTISAEKDFAAARAKADAAGWLNNMCWAKATAGVALESALADCNAALAKAPNEPAYQDSRGLVLLRLGRIDEAIAEYDRALAKEPSLAASLFGRAVAWARKGEKAKSEADAAAALKADADTRDEFERYGITL